uniref:Chymotrypsinogen A n=1 Tax=Lygus hesperus TaxID=30085 RepID=A0A0A9Y128_LYGHE
MGSSNYVFPMHPSTWEVWKTKVVKAIFDSLGSTIDQCRVTVSFLYESENGTRPDGFHVNARHVGMDGEFRQAHYLVKGYVSNPSTIFNENVAVQEAFSSFRCTEVLDRADRYYITSVPSDSGYLARYERLTVVRIMSRRWSDTWLDSENSSTPETLDFFQNLISRYRTNSQSVPLSLRSMGKPGNPIPDSKEFAKIWKTKFETPLWDSSNSSSPDNWRLKRASISLDPTYDGDSLTPSGLLIVGSQDRGPSATVTYIKLPITSELDSFSTERPQNESVNSCQLPPKPKGTAYRIGDCQPNQRDGICEKEPGSWVVEYTQINYECDNGYVLPRINDVDWSDSLCMEGEWDRKIRCQKKCGPLISPSHDIQCKYYGNLVNCTEEVFPGTVAKPKCKSHFHARDPVEVYAENACLADGNWEYGLFECIPDCGLSKNTTGRFRISNGEDVVPGDYPWAAGLFWKKNGTFEHFCGGSIINSNLILTAAHCIYDEGTGMDRDPSEIIVAVGKFNISWDIIDEHEQRIKVLKINKPSSYGRISRSSTSYFDDIAVIELSEIINFSEFRLPVCLDWRKRGSFRNGTLGTTVGWGNDENHRPSDSLQCAVLPYLDDNSCSEMSPGYFRTHMLGDKFCVGSGEDHGTSVQPGDSGGGFTFIRHKFHFLYGVLSIRPHYSNRFALFTNVTLKLDWLKQWAKRWPTPT